MLSKTDESYLECEKKWVYAVLMVVSGFYGAFTFSIRGGVFCNGQTGNFVLFAVSIGNGEFRHALYYLIPMTAYLLGAIVSEAVPNQIKKLRLIRWDTFLILFEIAAVILLGFLPESAPFQISQVVINFICSMQYNTFRQAQGIPMATTFCTNNLRQVGIWLVKGIRNKSRDSLVRAFYYFETLLYFIIGAAVSALLCRFFLGKAIWFSLIPLAVVFGDLLYADLKTERSQITRKPHGH
ncbi:MAG: DUF1275 domain-containing protein [Ruminococcus sp.]|nr:DUF1275 domain-containing protein [Ruminococcus sp.]